MSPKQNYFCLRVDLDYVPWDTPDARDFGHGEPAMVLRLLDLARQHDYRMHFFASNRVLRAFPSIPDALLNDGHCLDWLCKQPSEFDRRYEEMLQLSNQVGQQMVGLALRTEWPAELADRPIPTGLRFVSSPRGRTPSGITHFPVDVATDRDTSRLGLSIRNWTDTAKTHLRHVASLGHGATVCVRPQVLAKFDARLSHVREVCELASAVGLQMATLRDLLPAERVARG